MMFKAHAIWKRCIACAPQDELEALAQILRNVCGRDTELGVGMCVGVCMLMTRSRRGQVAAWCKTDLNMGRKKQTKKKTPAMAKQCLGRFLMPAQHQGGILNSVNA